MKIKYTKPVFDFITYIKHNPQIKKFRPHNKQIRVYGDLAYSKFNTFLNREGIIREMKKCFKLKRFNENIFKIKR